MKKYCLKHLPHWVLTDLQPAFYDCESATAVQQTAKIYAKMQELISLYNEFTNQVNQYITEFEDGIIKDFNCFQNCVIKTMNDYIESIDMKIELQDNNIQEAIDYMKNNLVSTVTNTLASGVTNSNTATKVLKNSSYSGTLSGITTETVAVTMGGETVTTDVYDSSSKKIEIEAVTGNIVITVS